MSVGFYKTECGFVEGEAEGEDGAVGDVSGCLISHILEKRIVPYQGIMVAERCGIEVPFNHSGTPPWAVAFGAVEIKDVKRRLSVML